MKDMAKDIDDKRRERTRAESLIRSLGKKNSDTISIVNAMTGRTTGRNLIKYNCLKWLISVNSAFSMLLYFSCVFKRGREDAPFPIYKKTYCTHDYRVWCNSKSE